ncbi:MULTISPECIES: LysE family translocator [unclassified Microbacterium]|uniref:LysE family translocator n=1 Tax=unclassified Microbacterium TaxID=2609290 RepID=UPI000EAAC928|nr:MULTISPECIES: LysE family translocator [unclassified Microbacterium]MBT2484142.1 LysE family translocator [Microbacterium sp. ISL-108]RKN67087.1 LysE family translocator [Microbacterium sp. CGR2]
MELATLLAFSIAAVVAIAIPGPTVLLALANGSRYGVRRATFGMLGAVASDIVLVVAVGLGLGALLLASELAFSVVKWVGVAYLAFLGIRMLRSRGALLHGDPGADPRGARGALFTKSFLVAVTNPKGYLFVGALLPQFIGPGTAPILQYLVIGALFCALDFTIMFAYAMLGSQAIRLLKKRGTVWIERVCGGVMLGLAAWLATSRRAVA